MVLTNLAKLNFFSLLLLKQTSYLSEILELKEERRLQNNKEWK